jgi:hypothetical protein
VYGEPVVEKGKNLDALMQACDFTREEVVET